MNTLPHRLLIIGSVMLFPLALSLNIAGQTSANKSSTATTPSQSISEGIQKRDNEWGVWGGISFDSPTVIGKTPNANFGNIGLRYGRVLAASKTVAFEWTIDAIPFAIFSGDRFTATPTPTGFVITQDRKSVYGAGAAPIGLKFNFRRNRRVSDP